MTTENVGGGKEVERGESIPTLLLASRLNVLQKETAFVLLVSRVTIEKTRTKKKIGTHQIKKGGNESPAFGGSQAKGNSMRTEQETKK